MSQIISFIARLLRQVGVFYNLLKFQIKKRTGLLGNPVIQPYYGFGNKKKVVVIGRVLEDNVLSKPIDRYKKWDNLVAMYRRYVSEFIPEVRVKLTFNGQEAVVCSDDEGYLEHTFELDKELPVEKDWFEVNFELLDRVLKKQGKVTATGEILVSERNSQFGIISDVDDTILISRATKFIKKIRLLLLKNSHTRLPFEGVAAFYRALQGHNTHSFNPIFYVSSSSWKLYDLLVDFCRVRGIPKGPFLLRNSRLDQFKFLSSIHENHKLKKIEQILSTYSKIKFILIGDSGQKDPEIYAQVVKDYPGRIEAIYIRDVSKQNRDQEVMNIANELSSEGIEMVHVQNTEQAARHAMEKGYIAPDSVPSIIGEQQKDAQYSDDPDEIMEEEQTIHHK
ncbi:MAG: App1 family protein [Candidatus Cyclobacteriaceae bacterium M3_2C_046]